MVSRHGYQHAYLSSEEYALRRELREDDDSSESGALIVINEGSKEEDSEDEYASTIEPKDEDASALSSLLWAKIGYLSEQFEN